MAAPQLRPPSEAWAKIQAATVREKHYGVFWPVLPLQWLLKSWPLAAGLMVAVFIHLAPVHPNFTGQSAAPAGTAGKQTDKTAAVALPKKTQPTGRENSYDLRPAATAQEASAGPWASVPGRMLMPVEDQARHDIDEVKGRETTPSNVGRHLPRLRPAIVLAMPSRMGLTNFPEAQTQVQAQPQPQVQAQAPLHVDYVDFPNPVVVAASEPASLGLGDLPAWAEVNSTIQPGSSSETVSMFASGNNLVVTIDPAALPAHHGPVTIWVEDADGNETIVGTVKTGVNLMVINIQNAALDGGCLYTVKAGGTNVLGSFP